MRGDIPSSVPTISQDDLVLIALVLIGIVVLYVAVAFGAFEAGRKVAFLPHGCEKERWAWRYERLGLIVLAYNAVVLVATPVLFYLVYEERLLEGLVAGLALLWFLRNQAPLLLPPCVGVFLHHWDTEGAQYREAAGYGDEVTAGAKTFLIIRVMNLSLSSYADCTCSITLPAGETGIRIIPMAEDGEAYEKVDFAKEFRLQRQNNCAAFFSQSGYQSLHPGDSLFCPVLVQVSSKAGALQIQVEVASRSAWFHKMVKRKVTVS